MQSGIDRLARRSLYRQYLQRIDGRKVLEYYGARNCTELAGREGSTEIVHSCLIDRVEPHHTRGDANPSASLNLDRKFYICYALGWGGDLLHLVAKLEGKGDNVIEALPLIEQFLDDTLEDDATFAEQLEKLLAEPDVAVGELPTYHERVLTPWAHLHPYLTEERGISAEAAARLGLGFDQADNRLVFPHWWGGKLVGWQKRAIPDRPGRWPGTDPPYPKYRSSSGFPRAETLYHYDEARRYNYGIVVESPMSVAKALSLGLPNAVASFGAKVSDHQIDLLREFPRVYVWFDDDEAGRAGERRIVQNLWRSTEVFVVLPEPGKDLADYRTDVEVLTMLDRAVPAFVRLADYEVVRRDR